MTSPTPAGSLKAAIEVIPPLPKVTVEMLIDHLGVETAGILCVTRRKDGIDIEEPHAGIQWLCETYARQYHAANSADLLDMAAVGEALMDTINANGNHPALKGWAPSDCPSEVVADLLNSIDESNASALKALIAAREFTQILESGPSSRLTLAEAKEFRASMNAAIAIIKGEAND